MCSRFLRTAALLGAIASSPLVRAAQVTVNWIGGTGTWTVASNWSPALDPNNGPDTYTVAIDGNNGTSSAVTLVPLAYGGISRTVDNLQLDAGDSLTLGWKSFNEVQWGSTLTSQNGAKINGTFTIGNSSFVVGPDGTISGTGTIQPFIGTTIWDSGGYSIRSTSGSLTLAPELTIIGAGTLGGRIGVATQPLINHARILGGAWLYGSTILNDGTIILGANQTLYATTTISSLAELGPIQNNGGSIILAGTLENTGRNFSYDGSLRVWGVIHGGSITVANGERLPVPYNMSLGLDNATLSAPMLLQGALEIAAGQTLQGNTDILMQFGPANIPDILAADRKTLTLGRGCYIHGDGNISTDTEVVNHGVINANSGARGGITTFGIPVQNFGTMESTTGGRLQLKSTYQMQNFGKLAVDDTGQLVATTSVVFEPGSSLAITIGPDQTRVPFTTTKLLDLSGPDDSLILDTTLMAPTTQTIITYITLSGTFDHVSPGFLVDYSTPGKISVTNVPEPTMFIVSAASFILYWRNRKTNGPN